MKKYEEAIEKIVNEYDAFFIQNKYGTNTHEKEFNLLMELITPDNKVANALAWIHNKYDCYYKKDCDIPEGPFEYLRNIVRQKTETDRKEKEQ